MGLLRPVDLAALCTLLGIALIIAVFAVALQFFYSYQRVQLGGDVMSSLAGLAGEAVYLLGKAAFLGLALLAATQLLRYGLGARGERRA